MKHIMEGFKGIPGNTVGSYLGSDSKHIVAHPRLTRFNEESTESAPSIAT